MTATASVELSSDNILRISCTRTGSTALLNSCMLCQAELGTRAAASEKYKRRLSDMPFRRQARGLSDHDTTMVSKKHQADHTCIVCACSVANSSEDATLRRTCNDPYIRAGSPPVREASASGIRLFHGSGKSCDAMWRTTSSS